MIRVFHIILNDDEVENCERWAKEENRKLEEFVQAMVDQEMEARLELERGEE